MLVPRRARLLAGGVLAVVAVLGTGGFLAPQTASAAPPSAEPTSGAVGPPPAVPPDDGPASGLADRTPTAVAHPVRRTSRARPVTRLALDVRPGRTLAAVGVLTRPTRSGTGARIAHRWIAVYVRIADRGRWRLARTLRTSTRGRVEYDVRATPLLQFTLRFRGDRRYRAAASATIVPEPTGARGLNPRLLTALARARAAAARVGLSVVVNSGFRTWARQQQMYDAAVRRYGSARAARRWVLPPQESTHVRGLAVDLGTPAAAGWLTVHGARFGLCRAYADEAWHFEYRPDWIVAFAGRCPPPVTTPGDPDPLSPAPRLPVL